MPQLKRPEDVPEEKPPEPPKKPRNVKGPRALALMQFGGKGKATLIPVAILVDGKFYDASLYKADPVPMALEAGTIYEVEQSGSSQGLFTISGALHSKTAGSAHPWLGAGSYLPNGTEAAKTTRKAEDKPVGIDSSGDDAPPRLTKGSASPPATPAPAANSPTGGSPGTSSPPASGTSSGSSDKPGASSPQKDTPAGGSSSGTAAANQPAAQPAQAQADQPQDSGSYYRPTLRRGKPAQSAPPEEESLPQNVSLDSKANATDTADAKPAPPPLVPAISDDGGPLPRSYKFFWKPGEEEDLQTQMLALARGEVRAYANALAKNRIPATPPPAPKPASARKPAPKPAEPVLDAIHFQGFDVWGNNQPVMILSAEAHIPPAPGSTAQTESYSVTIVAKTDIYGSLHKLYSGVTDKFHLDVTPKLELIDAVDADGDGRGELLFRETTDAGSGFVIYRPTADKLWKMFDSLGGNG